MIDTEQELLDTLAIMRGLAHRWVAQEPGTKRFYVTGKPFPTVAPNVVAAAVQRGVLVEHTPGLWSRPEDRPSPHIISQAF
jgi:hypothetical protein